MFFVSLFLMVKNSEIPYVLAVPQWFRIFFNQPSGDFWLYFSQMVDLFSTAYVTSLFFYLIVDYIPAQKQKERVNKIITPCLVRLNFYIEYLCGIIEFVARQQGLIDSGENFNEILFSNQEITYRLVRYMDGEERCREVHHVKFLQELGRYGNLIIQTCDTISSALVFSFCEDKTVNVISGIQLSDLLGCILSCADRIDVDDENRGFQMINFAKRYHELKELKKKLESEISKLGGKIHLCNISEIPKEKKNHAEKEKQ